MKAAYIQRTGDASNIHYRDLPTPTIGPCDVLVKVAAVTVNNVDTDIRSGAIQTTLPIPFIIGRDMTGIVEKVGEEVCLFHPGERVWTNNQGYDGRQGTFAEYVSIAENMLYHLPPNVDLYEAVTVLHSGLTAIIGLFDKAHLRNNESIFINGGDDAIGTAVVQLARAMGARIIVTSAHPEKMQWCEELGVDLIINHKTQNVNHAIKQFAPQGVDVYWDATNHAEIECALAAIAQRGRIIIMAGPQHQTTLMVGPFYTKNCSLYGFTVSDATVGELHTCASQIDYWLGRGVLRGKVALRLPLSRAAEAHRLNESGSLFGKIILSPEWE